ncbi:hypothetical protein GWI33_022036 [Rhynchophorus ferrugineus]|uniref:Uncharacterized protein n=1 Tax=Rhynchophorus ferrugineus TaxID=354439 RepID=A0A834J0Q7_RHYFE|nr:hypothetical protein GWI33_022036 [Rhynchophorus ferrugineus]
MPAHLIDINDPSIPKNCLLFYGWVKTDRVNNKGGGGGTIDDTAKSYGWGDERKKGGGAAPTTKLDENHTTDSLSRVALEHRQDVVYVGCRSLISVPFDIAARWSFTRLDKSTGGRFARPPTPCRPKPAGAHPSVNAPVDCEGIRKKKESNVGFIPSRGGARVWGWRGVKYLI